MRYLLAPILFAWIGLAGCGPDYGKAQGFWEGRMDVEVAPGTPSTVAATIQKYRIRLMPEGNFSMMRKGFPVEGRCSFSGDTITLIPETALGQRLLEKAPFEVKVRLGGGGLTVTDLENGKETQLKLKRVQPWE